MGTVGLRLKQRDFYKANSWDYILVTLLIAVTGFSFCFRLINVVFFVFGPIAAYLFYKRRRVLNQPAKWFFIILFCWCYFQFSFGQSTLSAVFNFYIRFVIYYLAATAVNEFEKVFIKVMYVITVVALICWITSNYIPGGKALMNLFPTIDIGGGFEKGLTTNPGRDLGFYFDSRSFRNSGPFWEPGMFAVFLNIALVLSIIKNKSITNKTVLIFLAGAVSTLSTTGLITTFAILIWFFGYFKPNAKSVFIFILIACGLLYFLNSDIGINKINGDMANQKEYSRFGAMFYHFTLLKDSILIGRGFASEELPLTFASPNGLSVVIMFWGVPFVVYYYYLLFKSSKKMGISINGFVKQSSVTVAVFVTILMVAFSQDVTTRHFYNFLIVYSLSPIRKVC